MYRLLFNSILLLFISLHVWAQGPGTSERRFYIIRGSEAGEQVQAERIAYYTKQIGLTTDEAQVFWPIYNEMDNKRNVLFEERAEIIHKFVNESEKLNDKQIDEYLNRLAAIQQKEAALPTEYDAKFRKVLPARKVMNMYVAEMGFRNYLLQRMRTVNPRMERYERQ